MVGFLTKAMCKIHQFTALISFTCIPYPNVKTLGKASLQSLICCKMAYLNLTIY